MSSITISPAYGRDYQNKKAAVRAFKEDADFLVESVSSPFCGKYVNMADLIKFGPRRVEVRYASKSKCAIIRL